MVKKSEELTTTTITITIIRTRVIPTEIRVRESLIISPTPAITRNEGPAVDEPSLSVVVRVISTVQEWLLEIKTVKTISTIIITALLHYHLRITITHRYPHPHSRLRAGLRRHCCRRHCRQHERDTIPRLIMKMDQDQGRSPDWCQRRIAKSRDLRSTGMLASTAVSMMANIENRTIINHDTITRTNVKLQNPRPRWNNMCLDDDITAIPIIMIVSRNAINTIMTIATTMIIESRTMSDSQPNVRLLPHWSVMG